MLELTQSTISLIGYGVGAAGLLFGYVQFHKKNQLEAKQSIAEKRFKIYSEYVFKLDSINSALTSTISGDGFQEEFNKLFTSISNGADTSQAISIYMKRIAEYTAVWGNARTKALEELSSLRLVCSRPILASLDVYSNLTKELIDALGELLAKVVSNPKNLMDLTLGDRVKQIHVELNKQIAAIENQMRLDIGADQSKSTGG
jgi:hypothetical protein